MQRIAIVDPSDLSVLRRVGRDRLILSACHPRFSARERIVVFARVQSVAPARLGRSANSLKGAAASAR